MSSYMPMRKSRLQAKYGHWWSHPDPKKPKSWWNRRSGAEFRMPPTQVNTSFDFARAQALQPVHWSGLDTRLIWVLWGLLMWGWVMVYSASIAMPENPRFGNLDSTHFALRHGLSLGMGLLCALFAFQIPMAFWRRLAPWVFVFSLVLLGIVLFPAVGHEVNGARRWVSFGIVQFQPSELAKLGVLLYAADYMVRKMDIKESFGRAIIPMVVALVGVGGLLLAEPDMGAFMVIAVIAMGILFLGGVNARMFFLTTIVIAAALAIMLYFSDWRRERVLAYLDPWNAKYVLGKSYQLSHALIAAGRGEIFGVGLGGSLEKLHWLPEVHTDFLTAVIAEEFGFVGVVVLALAFCWLVHRIMDIGRQAIALNHVFSGLVAQGTALWLGLQAFINMGVNFGVLPTKGLTLPLMSYGGSAMLFNLIALALVLRVDYENRRIMQGKTP